MKMHEGVEARQAARGMTRGYPPESSRLSPPAVIACRGRSPATPGVRMRGMIRLSRGAACRLTASDGWRAVADRQTGQRRCGLVGRKRGRPLRGFRVTGFGLAVMWADRRIKGVKQDQLLPRLMPGWNGEGEWGGPFPRKATALGGAICDVARACIGVQRRAGSGRSLVARTYPRFRSS
jgi:hypothetical protein